jgi:hypothetical protein
MQIAIQYVPSIWRFGDDDAFWCEHPEYEVEHDTQDYYAHPDAQAQSYDITVAVCTDCGEDLKESLL